MGAADESGAHVPALQVIILGSGGGPIEHNTTAFLVRSLAAGWGKGSLVAVDAGVHLGAISRILEQTQPAGLGTKHALPYTLSEGAFAGLEVASASAATNAGHITRSLVDTYLITHPHLDHISGLVINTAGLPGTRAKRIAGLPSTIAAIKTHIFNNVIWPNLSDENNGAGLLTYMRLVEGGSPAMGEGEGRGYLEVSDGLAVKVYGVSHGHCIERHSHRGSSSGPSGAVAAAAGGGPTLGSPRHSIHSHSHAHSPAAIPGGTVERVNSGGVHTPTAMSRVPSLLAANSTSGGSQDFFRESVCVYDSSAYFLRDVNTGREVLIFGDVEPDSISLSPRNLAIWQEAAPKIAAGQLAAVLIECSYDDAQSVDRLYGHLKPCYVAEEMRALAAEVQLARQDAVLAGEARRTKRKRDVGEDHGLENGNGLVLGESRKRATSQRPRGSGITDDELSPRTTKPLRPSSTVLGEDVLQMPHFPQGYGPEPGAAMITDSPTIAGPTAELSLGEVEALPDPVIAPPGDAGRAMAVSEADASAAQPLRGLKVVIIHVKERLTDGPEVKDTILEQLLEYEAEDRLGCEYVISSVGQSLYL